MKPKLATVVCMILSYTFKVGMVVVGVAHKLMSPTSSPTHSIMQHVAKSYKSSSALHCSRDTGKIHFGATNGAIFGTPLKLWGKSPNPAAESAGCERQSPSAGPASPRGVCKEAVLAEHFGPVGWCNVEAKLCE